MPPPVGLGNAVKITQNGANPIKSEEMPIKAHMVLTHIEKYSLFGKFPWAVLFHIILLILDSIWLIKLNNISALYIQHQEILWYNQFMNPGMDVEDLWIDREHTYNNVSDLADLVKSNIDWVRHIKNMDDAKDDLDDGQWSNNLESYVKYCKLHKNIWDNIKGDPTTDADPPAESIDEDSIPHLLSEYSTIVVDCKRISGETNDPEVFPSDYMVKIPILITIEFHDDFTPEKAAEVLKDYSDLISLNSGTVV